MIIIPAIDLIDGKVVRLFKGDYSEKKIYEVDPIELCSEWKAHGISRIHIVDLQGALNGNQKNLSTIKKIKEKTDLEIQLGGGIRNYETSKSMLDIGIAKVIFGTAAIESPNEISKTISKCGGDKVIVGIDLYKEKIKISGWTKDTNITYQELINDFKSLENYISMCKNNLEEAIKITPLNTDPNPFSWDNNIKQEAIKIWQKINK